MGSLPYLLLTGFCTFLHPLFHPFPHFPAPTEGDFLTLSAQRCPFLGPQRAFFYPTVKRGYPRFRPPTPGMLVGETSVPPGSLPPGLRRDSEERDQKGAERVQKDKKPPFSPLSRPRHRAA